MSNCKFQVGDVVTVVAMTSDEDIDQSLIGQTGPVIVVQASNEDKPDGPDGPWVVTIQLNADDTAWFTEDELVKA